MSSEDWFRHILGSASSSYSEGYEEGVKKKKLDDDRANIDRNYYRGWQDGTIYGEDRSIKSTDEMEDVELYKKLPDQFGKKPKSSGWNPFKKETPEVVDPTESLMNSTQTMMDQFNQNLQQPGVTTWTPDGSNNGVDSYDQQKNNMYPKVKANAEGSETWGEADSEHETTYLLTEEGPAVKVEPVDNGYKYELIEPGVGVVEEGVASTLSEAQAQGQALLEELVPVEDIKAVEQDIEPVQLEEEELIRAAKSKGSQKSQTTTSNRGTMSTSSPMSEGLRTLTRTAKSILDSGTWFDGSSNSIANRIGELNDLKSHLGKTVKTASTNDKSLRVASDLIDQVNIQIESLNKVAESYLDPEQEEYLASLPASHLAVDYSSDADGDLGEDDGSFLYAEASKIRDEVQSYDWNEFVSLGSQHFVYDKEENLLRSASMTRMAAVDYARDKTMVLLDTAKRAKVIDDFVTNVEKTRREVVASVVECPACNGTGLSIDHAGVVCTNCHGDGTISTKSAGVPNHVYREDTHDMDDYHRQLVGLEGEHDDYEEEEENFCVDCAGPPHHDINYIPETPQTVGPHEGTPRWSQSSKTAAEEEFPEQDLADVDVSGNTVEINVEDPSLPYDYVVEEDGEIITEGTTESLEEALQEVAQPAASEEEVQALPEESPVASEPVPCGTCGGVGGDELGNTCPSCQGEGLVVARRRLPFDRQSASMSEDEDEGYLKCKDCPKRFDDHDDLDDHYLSYHDTKNSKVAGVNPCPNCGGDYLSFEGSTPDNQGELVMCSTCGHAWAERDGKIQKEFGGSGEERSLSDPYKWEASKTAGHDFQFQDGSSFTYECQNCGETTSQPDVHKDEKCKTSSKTARPLGYGDYEDEIEGCPDCGNVELNANSIPDQDGQFEVECPTCNWKGINNENIGGQSDVRKAAFEHNTCDDCGTIIDDATHEEKSLCDECNNFFEKSSDERYLD